RAVKGLKGYNVYRDNAFVSYVAHPTLEAFDYNLNPGVYSYHVTAVYDLTPYGYPGQTAESMIEGPIDVEVIYGFDLPFIETFDNGFTLNKWTTDGENWVPDGQAGNPAPSAKFTYSPVHTDYTLSLTSSWMNGIGIDGYIDGKFYLDFDLKLDDNTATGDEKMIVEIFNGSAWVPLATYTAEGDMDWESKHIDITSTAKNKVFRVRFTAKGLNTLDINNWLVDNVHIYRSCDAPTNFVAKINDHFGDQVELTWEAPEGPVVINAWLAWDSGTNTGNGVGMNGGGTFSCAARFTAAQLTEYAGANLTKIRIFPNAATGSTFVLKVWTGANASQLVVSQPVPSFVDSQWNEFVLNAPVPVTATTELWFGYTVTHANGAFPAGCDEGPAVAGFGDMISMDGIAWDPMSVLVASLNYNWNIEGFVESTGKAPVSLQPVVDPSVYTSNGTLVLSTNAHANSVSVPADNTKGRELTGYKIFRDGNFLISTTETSYLDNDPAISVLGKEVCYKVTAVYTDCESDFSNDSCVIITSNGDIATEVLSIYPNPSNDMVNIELTDNISQFVVYNYLGQVVAEQVVTKNQTVRLNVSNYDAGAYMVKFITRSGESISRKIVVTK
ncbi:MAG: T9SS type A sorting domain-containing protein, partial [Lentimicrobiaceae bacterium]